ncbi:MAG: TrkH family potassium uptake protein [bacterium]|nr:TrkH family potassium uptake protein [bacterium]
MNVRTVFWLVGVVLAAVALAETPALLLALALGEAWEGFAISIGLGGAIALGLRLSTNREGLELDHRAAILAVSVAWISSCVLGAVPLVMNPAAPLSAIDAFFESASGFTTTGATVLSGLDTMPRSILLWRSLMHWLGGMGMVLLGVAIFPILGLGGMQLFRAEAPGPTKDKLTPRIAETAKILWVLYFGLTAALIGLFLVGGMSFFDAICHSMSTVSTGGFSTHDRSIAYFDSSFINVVTSIFMLVCGMSFAISHRALTQGIQWRAYPELRAYVGIVTAGVLLISFDLRLNMPEEFGSATKALEHALFQAAAVTTTTGLATRDFDLWPSLSHSVILALFFVGGMAGSTAGGVKVIRVVILARLAASQFFRLVHPRGVAVVRLGDKALDDQIVLGVLGFIGMWLILVLAGTMMISAFGHEVTTSFSAAAVTLGNIGPGFGEVGPSQTYANFEPGAKLVMSALMILGRLEIFSVLVLLTPGYWRG